MSVKKKKITKKKVVKRSVKKTVSTPVKESPHLERDKQLAMWAGVIFIMVIIVTIWGFNFKNNIEVISSESASESTTELEDIFNDFNKVIEQTKEEISEFKESAILLEDQDLSELEEMEQRIELENFLSRFNQELENN